MSRTFNVAQPTVINTELRPLDESFYIKANGQLEQWFYDNTSQYAPDRRIISLILTPELSVFDADTQSSYSTAVADTEDPEHLSFFVMQWFATEYNSTMSVTYAYAISASAETADSQTAPADVSSWSSTVVATTTAMPYAWVREVRTATVNGTSKTVTRYFCNTSGLTYTNTSGGGYWEEEITNITNSQTADYVISDNTLIVKKNVVYSHGVTIRCIATYIDPRDSGVTYTVQDTVTLTTNRDATVIYPEVAIASPSARTFNPLTDWKNVGGVDTQDSEFEFDGVVTNSPDVEHVISEDLAQYKVDGWGTEEIESASGSCSPTMTIRYPDGSIETDARFMYRKTADGTKLDVSGNAFVTNIKGETVAWNQLIYNGNFANGLTAWTNYGTGSTVSVENGKLKVVPASNNQGANYYYNFNTPLGHKMYYDFKVISPTTGTLLLYKNSNNISGFPLIVGEKRIQSILTVGSGYAGTHINFLFRFPIAGETYYLYDVRVFDLTLIYGSGNEPTTAAAFEADYLKWFGKPLGFETYDTGSLKPVKMLSMKTVGFNLFDKDKAAQNTRISSTGDVHTQSGYFCSDYIKVFPNTQYYLRNVCRIQQYTTCIFYDINKNFIGYTNISGTGTGSGTITTSSNTAYIRTNTGLLSLLDSTCVSLVNDGSRNGQYASSWSNTSMLNVTELKGRVVTNGQATGNLVTIFPNGLLRARSVRDEIYVENGKIYAVKRVGRLNLGTVNYLYVYGSFYYSGLGSKPPSATTEIADFKMPLYPTGTQAAAAQRTCYGTSGGGFYLKDSALGTDPAAFKTAMNGVYLHYRLNTAVTYEIDEIQSPFIFKWFGINSSGQEVDATTMPWYKEGQDTSKLKVDAMYGENINVVLRCTKGAGLNELSPSKAYASLSWRVPEIDCHVVSQNGQAVRTSTGSMTFGTTINVNGEVLSDNRRDAHLRFNWKYRASTSTTENDAGWGTTKEIANSNLIHVKSAVNATLASTIVYPKVYLLGAWKPATSTTTDYDKPTTTKDGVNYERTID